MKAFRFITLLFLATHVVSAQKSAPPAQPPATGSITGHVFLGDSHLPARMAYVTLLPAGAADAAGKKPAASSATVQTGLDGAYVMNNVLPGAYYVVAGKLGYATTIPVAYLDPDAYDSAPREVKEALAASVNPTLVAANRASRTDIVLDKGAVISGSVLFDDGEPDTQAVVSLLHKEKSGKWAEFATQEGIFSGARTDDQGNFRVTGLPPGEYLLRTTLELEGGHVISPGAESTPEPDYRWDVYLGYGIRPSEGKIIKLKEGEQSAGNTIEIPLARLHSITGTVVSAETSAPINSARVELHNASDDSTCTTTMVNSDNGQFHFPYVAEGEYTLKVLSAVDVIPSKSVEQGDGAPLHDAKVTRTYADASQSLIVKGETNGITITVKPQAPGAAPVAPTTATQ